MRPGLRDAREARHFGQLINAYRHEHRPVLTQAKVGRWLGLTQGQISRVERTAQPTRDLHKLEQWACALRIPERYLWFQLSSPGVCSLDDESERGGEGVERRLVLHAVTVGVASAGGSTFGWFTPQSPMRSRTRAVGMADVQVIREMTQTFRQLDNRFGGGRARSSLTTYLASEVLPLLRAGRYREDVRRELFAAVAELDQLAGWMAYDVGDIGSGQRYLRQAMRRGHDIGDDALAGEMLAGMSHQAARFCSPVVAVDLAQAAKDHGKRAGVPALVSESAVMEACGFALVNDVRGCLAALRESEQAFAVAQGRERPEWLGYFDDAYLAGKFGRCFRDLGRPAEAEEFARRALDMLVGYERRRLFNSTLLASILADQRKVEEACETGLAALQMASDVRSVRTDADLVDLSRRLTPFQAEPAVQSLQEQIRVLIQRAGGV
ncbi:MAG: XRE family transcriptional regulator [Pseudonocardiaceae bacterium]